MKKADVMLDAPGLILPVIHEKEGRPVFKVTLTEPLKEEACIVKDGKTVLLQRKREEADAWIRAISWENDNFLSISAQMGYNLMYYTLTQHCGQRVY